MKKVILLLFLAILIGNTKIYVEDYQFIEHYDTNEICIIILRQNRCFYVHKGHRNCQKLKKDVKILQLRQINLSKIKILGEIK